MNLSAPLDEPARIWEVADLDLLTPRPLVSVLMPTYNHVAYIADAIESVLGQQTDFDFELVISDDASTDGTTELALGFQRRYPRVIRVMGTSRNTGMIANHDRLIRAGRGRYFAFCEGDDYWTDPAKLKTQATYLEQEANVGLVHSDFQHIALVRGTWRCSSGGRAHPQTPYPAGAIYPAMLKGNLIQTCTVMIRATVVADYIASGLPFNTYAVGDWPLFLFASGQAEIGYIDAVQAVYRKTPGSQMNQGHRAALRRAESYIAMIEDSCRYFTPTHEHLELARAQLMRHLALAAVRAGDFDRAGQAEAWLDQHSGIPRPWSRQRLRRTVALHHLLAQPYSWALALRETVLAHQTFKLDTPDPVRPVKSTVC